MNQKMKLFHEFMEQMVKIFNFAFFVASAVFWIILTVKNISQQPFELSLLWSAFNEMYGQFSFKVGCILLIIFNGLGAMRGFFQQYLEVVEQVQHGHRLKNFLKKIFFGGKN